MIPGPEPTRPPGCAGERLTERAGAAAPGGAGRTHWAGSVPCSKAAFHHRASRSMQLATMPLCLVCFRREQCSIAYLPRRAQPHLSSTLGCWRHLGARSKRSPSCTLFSRMSPSPSRIAMRVLRPRSRSNSAGTCSLPSCAPTTRRCVRNTRICLFSRAHLLAIGPCRSNRLHPRCSSGCEPIHCHRAFAKGGRFASFGFCLLTHQICPIV